MEDRVFPKNIQLGEYEFKFLTELEVELDSQGNVITKTMRDIFNIEKNSDDKLEDFEDGKYCFIKADRYSIENTNCIYFIITENNQILNNIHSNKNFSISLFDKVNLSSLVIRKTKTRNHGRQSFRRLNRLICYMKEQNIRVSVYYTAKLDNDKQQLNNIIDCINESNIYSFYSIENIEQAPILNKQKQKIYIEDADMIKQINMLLQFKKQIILQGAPGTGKTYTAKIVAKEMMQSEPIIIQFHPSYTYEDFVRGIVSKIDENGNIKYEVEDKVLMNVIKQAEENKTKNYVLIIDEINRANLSSVLGELLYALEYRGEPVICSYKKEKEDEGKITIPENLYIIGTMNTADRSIGSIDYAIRRRFSFYTIKANAELIKDEYSKKIFNYIKTNIINKFLSAEYILDDIMIGHSYFIFNDDVYNDTDLLRENMNLSLKYNIIPLLEEYYKDGILIDKENEKVMEKIQFEKIIKEAEKYSENI